jgi:hypothetical protein
MNEFLAQLYREISTAADVQRLADEKRPESLYLEFKQKRDMLRKNSIVSRIS